MQSDSKKRGYVGSGTVPRRIKQMDRFRAFYWRGAAEAGCGCFVGVSTTTPSGGGKASAGVLDIGITSDGGNFVLPSEEKPSGDRRSFEAEAARRARLARLERGGLPVAEYLPSRGHVRSEFPSMAETVGARRA